MEFRRLSTACVDCMYHSEELGFCMDICSAPYDILELIEQYLYNDISQDDFIEAINNRK